jgi:hypothetical protein
MDFSRVDPGERHGPSAALACELCASVLSMETLRLLLGWGTPEPAPRFWQLDLRARTWSKGTVHWGNRGPLQRAKRAWLARRLEAGGVRLALAER